MRTIKIIIISLCITFLTAFSAFANDAPTATTVQQTTEKEGDKKPSTPKDEDTDIITVLYCKYIAKCQ